MTIYEVSAKIFFEDGAIMMRPLEQFEDAGEAADLIKALNLNTPVLWDEEVGQTGMKVGEYLATMGIVAVEHGSIAISPKGVTNIILPPH